MLYICCEKCYQAFCSEKCSSEMHLFELSRPPLNPRCREVFEVLTSVGWIFAFDNTYISASQWMMNKTSISRYIIQPRQHQSIKIQAHTTNLVTHTNQYIINLGKFSTIQFVQQSSRSNL
jgi:hypothetical protein